MTDGLLYRVAAELQRPASGLKPEDLSGLFNRYRPTGDGLERLFPGEGVEAQVKARLQKIYEATAPGFDARDLYFSVSQPCSVSADIKREFARRHLVGMGELALFTGQGSLAAEIAGIEISDDELPPVEDTIEIDIYDVSY